MRQDGDEIHADADDVRGASTPNVVRWVLAISLGAAIVLLTAIWLVGAWSNPGATHNLGDKIRAEQERNGGSDTDSLVGQHAGQMDGPTPGADERPLNMPNKNATSGQ